MKTQTLGEVFVDHSFAYAERMVRRDHLVQAITRWQKWCKSRLDVLAIDRFRDDETKVRWMMWRNIITLYGKTNPEGA